MHAGETMDGSTLASTLTDRGNAGQPNIPCLTIAYHPYVHRIGEQLRMGELVLGQSVDIGRLAPDWRTPSGQKSRGLNDPFLSRKPLRFTGHSDGVLTATSPPVSTCWAL
jgi:two-component system nitrogen regulation response regulator GlnG